MTKVNITMEYPKGPGPKLMSDWEEIAWLRQCLNILVDELCDHRNSNYCELGIENKEVLEVIKYVLDGRK